MPLLTERDSRRTWSYKHFAPALKKGRESLDTNNDPPSESGSIKRRTERAMQLSCSFQFFDADFQAEHLQATNEVFALLLSMVPIKIIAAEFGVTLIVL